LSQPLKIGTKTPWGPIHAVVWKDGERAYFLMNQDKTVSLMPADVVEPVVQGFSEARGYIKAGFPADLPEFDQLTAVYNPPASETPGEAREQDLSEDDPRPVSDEKSSERPTRGPEKDR